MDSYASVTEYYYGFKKLMEIDGSLVNFICSRAYTEKVAEKPRGSDAHIATSCELALNRDVGAVPVARFQISYRESRQHISWERRLHRNVGAAPTTYFHFPG